MPLQQDVRQEMLSWDSYARTKPAEQSPLRVRVFTDLDWGDDFVPAWRAMTSKPMSTPQWLLPWWDQESSHLPPHSLRLLAFYDRMRLVAVSPLYRHRGRQLKLLGGGRVCSDHIELIEAHPDYVDAASETLFKLLTTSGLLAANDLRLEHVDVDSRTARIVESWKRTDRGSLIIDSREDGNTCRVMLPECWDDYLAKLSKNHRKRCRRWQKKYFDSGLLRVVSTQTGWDQHAAFAALVELHNKRRRAIGGSGAFEDPRFCRYHREMVEDLVERDEARITGLVAEGRVVATEYELLTETTIAGYQSGIDPTCEIRSIGSLSLMASMQAAIQEGRYVYDFLRGAEDYKFHWNAQRHATLRFDIRQRDWAGFVGHALSSAWQTARDIRNLTRR